MVRLDKLFENFEDQTEPKECEKNGGPLPSWLQGTMVRNGPGLFKAGDSEVKHWFDGMAYIQRYHFQSGKLFYSARFLDSEQYRKVKDKNRLVVTSFGTFRHSDPCQSIYSRFMSHFESEPMSDNCLVAFAQIGDSVYALTELPKMIEVDLDTLEAKRTVDVSEFVSLNTFTAHHQGDFEGNTFNIGSKYGKGGHYVFTETKNPKNCNDSDSGSISNTLMVGQIPQSDFWNPSYFHSFGKSENYFILMESPVRLSIKMMMVRNLLHYSAHDCLYWKEGENTNVLVMDKRNGKEHSIKYTSPPFFTFHHANSFEKDGFLVTDYCRMENPGKFDDFLMEHLRDGTFQTRNSGSKPFLHRMVIPLTIPEGAVVGDDLAKSFSLSRGATAILREDGSIECNDVRLCPISFEFPRYNWEKKNTLPYSFVYGSSLLFEDSSEDTTLTGIVKANVIDGSYQLWKRDHEEQLCGEPIFVPNPEGKEEDDGVLIIPVMTVKQSEYPFILILNAGNLEEICRFNLPTDRIPAGFHAHYVERVL